MMTEYDCQGIFMLGMEIVRLLGLEDETLLLSDYYYTVKQIYNDYVKHDDPSIDWLTCIDNYINSNADRIRNMVASTIDW